MREATRGEGREIVNILRSNVARRVSLISFVRLIVHLSSFSETAYSRFSSIYWYLAVHSIPRFYFSFAKHFEIVVSRMAFSGKKNFFESAVDYDLDRCPTYEALWLCTLGRVLIQNCKYNRGETSNPPSIILLQWGWRPKRFPSPSAFHDGEMIIFGYLLWNMMSPSVSVPIVWLDFNTRQMNYFNPSTLLNCLHSCGGGW